MRVTFMATADDLVDVTVRSLARDPGAFSGLRKRGVILGGVFGAVSFLLIPLAIETRMLIGVLVLFGWAATYPWLYWRLLNYRMWRYYQSLLGTESAFEVQVELSPNGVRVQQFGYDLLYPWGNIEAVTEGPDSLDFWTRPDGILAVRNRAFSTPTQMDEFLSLAGSYLSHELPTRDQPPESRQTA